MRRDVGAAAALIVVIAIAHGAVLGQWWLWDDPQLLYGAMHAGATDHFLSPEIAQRQSATFTPMLLLATEIDLSLFGLNPRWFYLHHLLVFAAAILAIYAYCRTFAGVMVASIAAATIALSRPAFTVAALLMDRHYAEGLLFAIAALVLFRRDRAIAATLLYLVACLEKEIFVPLPLLVPAQDWVTRSGRLVRNAILCTAAAAIYLAWRFAILGSFGGLGSAAGSAWEMASAGWSIVAGTTATAVFVVALLVLALRRSPRMTAALVVASMIVVALPIARLVVHDSRYFFVAAVVIVVLSAMAVPHLRSIEMALFGALAVSIVIGGLVHRSQLRPQLALMQRDGLYLWNEPATAKPLFSGAEGWYLEGLRHLRAVVKKDQAPEAIASLPGLVIRGLEPLDTAVATPRDPRPVIRAYEIVRAGFDPSLPLHVRLTRRDNVLSWSFAPAAPGDAFFFVTPVQELGWTRTAEGWIRLPCEFHPPTAFAERPRVVRVMRRSGEKWTVSPQITLPQEGGTVAWESVVESAAREEVALHPRAPRRVHARGGSR